MAEPVSAVSYSSDLLVTFFTLLALLAATAFARIIFALRFWREARALCAPWRR